MARCVRTLASGKIDDAYCVENNCALEFIDGELSSVVSAGGRAFKMQYKDGKIIKSEIYGK